MDPWKYFDIIHKHHTFMNPVSEERLDVFLDLLQLPKTAKVTDIGCGKGEMLIRLAEKRAVKGVGVDKSPYCIREATSRRVERVPQMDLEFLEMDGSDYEPEVQESNDLTMCIGASWIFGGYRNTLKALSNMTKPAGNIMVGEPFWRKPPPQSYLGRAKLSRRAFNTHRGNVEAGESVGLSPLYALVSDVSDWDKYEGLHWYAAREYAIEYPEDPDVKELLARDSKGRENYLKFERDILGWAIYLFQKLR